MSFSQVCLKVRVRDEREMAIIYWRARKKGGKKKNINWESAQQKEKIKVWKSEKRTKKREK